jgi:hypothetical protein
MIIARGGANRGDIEIRGTYLTGEGAVPGALMGGPETLYRVGSPGPNCR